MQRIDQRVAVFVDVQNMYYSARALFDAHVNFGEILKEATGNRKLIRAFAYVIQAEQEDETSFFDALRDRGFELRAKPIQNFRGGNQKGDWDIGIAMDIVQMLPKLDAIILVSGDGDFAELLKYVKSRGVRAEVMAFGSSASGLLRAEADAVCDLAAEPDRFLMPKKHAHAPMRPSAVKPQHAPHITAAPAVPTQQRVTQRAVTQAPRTPVTPTAAPAARQGNVPKPRSATPARYRRSRTRRPAQ